MEITNLDRRRLLSLWGEHGDLVLKVLKVLQERYELELGRKGTEWEMAQEMTEYLAKKQCLVDLHRLLSEKL